MLILVSAFLANPWKTGVGWMDGIGEKFKINLGLDLQGGAHLVYQADMSKIDNGREADALDGVRDVIEKRVNAYGVSEPTIQSSKTGDEYRIIVELAGVKDIDEAKKMIKETPLLEFKKEGAPMEISQEQKDFLAEMNKGSEEKAKEILEKVKNGEDFAELAKENSSDPGSAENGGDLDFFGKGAMVEEFEKVVFDENLKAGEVFPELVKSDFGLHIIKKTDERGEGEEKEIRASHILFRITGEEEFVEMMGPNFEDTGLTGSQLDSAQVSFNPQTNLPEVALKFDSEGTELFKNITEENIGKTVAIFLDGEIISAPTVQDVIRNGEAVINGSFGLAEAKELASRLNAGALPVPITLVSQQSVEATLGKVSLEKSLRAGLVGLLVVSVFMIAYYRLAGLMAVLALAIYAILIVAILKISSITPLSITLTLSGIAGFILSIGMAVDANILIFERMKEELKSGRGIKSAIDEGYRRAWSSIRDANYSTILTALILMLLGTGSIKGFALTLIIGVLLSIFTAVVITRILLNFLVVDWIERNKLILLVGTKNKK